MGKILTPVRKNTLMMMLIILSISSRVTAAECKYKMSRCKECKEDQESCVSCKNPGDWKLKDTCYDCSLNYMCEKCSEANGCEKCKIGYKLFKKDNLNYCQKREQNCNPGNDRCQFCLEKSACTICADPMDYVEGGICKPCSGLPNCKMCDKNGCSECQQEYKVKKEEGKIATCHDFSNGNGSRLHVYLLLFVAGGVVLGLILIISGYMFWKSRVRGKKLREKSRMLSANIVDVDKDLF